MYVYGKGICEMFHSLGGFSYEVSPTTAVEAQPDVGKTSFMKKVVPH
jgi:hypothetical protein